jgi:hypothetical protein
MKRVIINIILAVFCSCLTYNSNGKCAAQVNNTSPDFILQDVCNIWSNYLRQSNTIEIECSTKTINNSHVEYSDAAKLVYQQPCSIREIYLSDGSKSVSGCNEKYSFSLKKNKDADDWVINNLAPNALSRQQLLAFPDFTDSSQIDSTNAFIVPALARGLMVTFVDFLPIIAQKPHFNIDSVEKIVEDDQELIHLTYTYKSPDAMRNQLVKGGEVWLMPNSYWLIKKAKSFGIEPGKKERPVLTIINEYDKNSDNIPIIKKHTFTLNSAEYNNVVTEMEFSFVPSASKIPFSRFTLSHYGLPEPDFDNSRRTNYVRYILMGLGGIMIIVALWRMIQKRREKM